MVVRFRAAAGTHLGTVRMNNEDSAVVSDQLLALADGMGGHAAGEVASVLAVRVFSEVDHAPGTDLDTNLLEAGRQARRALLAMSDADPVLESLGTTLITVVTNGDKVVVGHLGDSRVYVLREDAMYQITTDHTHVQRMIDQGQLTPDQARTHPYRAMLLKSLDDHDPGPDLDLIDVSLQAGDRLLLCSDGLSDYLNAEQIGQALATEDLQAAVQALIDSALRAATRDNVTVVVADVEIDDEIDDEGADPGPDTAPLTPPGYAGAVLDGIQLSEPAAQALEQALPGLVLDPQEPWRGSTLLDEAIEQDGPLDLETPPADSAAPAETEDATPAETENVALADAAEVPEDAWAPAASAGQHTSADTRTATDTAGTNEQPTAATPDSPADGSAHTTPRPAAADRSRDGRPTPVFPGVLAGVFTIAVLVLFTLFLLG